MMPGSIWVVNYAQGISAASLSDHRGIITTNPLRLRRLPSFISRHTLQRGQ